MKLTVKLYGTLSQHFPDYQPAQGLKVELPEGSTVSDLFALLKISASHRPVVIVEGKVLKAGDLLRRGLPVNVFQAIHGG
jgi:sulfur carrier protein ThiS